jgi:hypothetical protein
MAAADKGSFVEGRTESMVFATSSDTKGWPRHGMGKICHVEGQSEA